MNDYVFYVFAILVFLYFCYKQFEFQRGMWFPFTYKEHFTPMQVNKILQEPGSQPIGTMDSGDTATSQMLTVSNGYSEKVINNLQPDNPEPKKQYDEFFGDFPDAEKENYPLPTTEFEHPNNYNFQVNYPCRRTATGMFTECGVWSANTAWTANPFKGLNCPLTNTKTPNQATSHSRSREMKNTHSHERETGISSIGNSMLR